MAEKKWLYVDVNKKTSVVSNITFEPEHMFKAYTKHAANRELYVSIDEVGRLNPELAVSLLDKALKPINKEPA